LEVFGLKQSSGGRHRADVQINALESFELRSRRQIREARNSKAARQALKAEKKAQRALKKAARFDVTVEAGIPARTTQVLIRNPLRRVRFFDRRPVRIVSIFSFAAGLIATASLPAYAIDPAVASMSKFAVNNNSELALLTQQLLSISGDSSADITRGNYSVKAAQALIQQYALNKYRLYNGPTAADYVANPPYSQISGGAVLAVASKYVGTPYVFGGENPSGFDCSGLVRFVYAQFGVDLPHSVRSQALAGIVVRREDALPGDIVILNDYSHDGIYAGNGNFYHAPRPGDTVKLAPIFTPNVFFLRIKPAK
jgi:cell wall-associated NlpC family hydrolase